MTVISENIDIENDHSGIFIQSFEYEKWLTSLASGLSVRKYYLRHEQDLFIYLFGLSDLFSFSFFSIAAQYKLAVVGGDQCFGLLF